MDNYLTELKVLLYNAVLKSIEGENRIGIMFSGGLDSSLIAFLTKDCAVNAKITLYTVGTFGSHDLSYAELASKILGMNLKKIEIFPEDIMAAIPKLVNIIRTTHPVKISFELPLYLCLERVDERVMLSGQGADELFGGYARYLTMDEEKLRVALRRDFESLISQDINMDYRIADYFNKTLRMPYLDEDVIKVATQIPIEYKVNKGRRKIILSKVALELKLPNELINKDKKAAQYSSGIIRELRRLAKKKKMSVHEIIEHLLKR